MSGVITGFTVIGSIILLGWFIARIKMLPERADQVLSRLSYFVFTPSLLLTVLSQSDSATLFSTLVPISMIASVSCFLIAAVITVVIWRKGVAETTIVSIASGYVNANNIGLPVALYVLGDAALAAPIILINMTFFAPIALTLLDASSRKQASWVKIITQPFRNPIIIASGLGVLMSFLEWDIPPAGLEPFRIVGGAAVPVMLIVLGMSLTGARVWAPGAERKEVALATVLKVAVMPIVAWAVGTFWFDLSSEALFAVVVLAALPTAQGVFAWAHRFNLHVSIARDSVLISTVLCIPVLALVAALLAPLG